MWTCGQGGVRKCGLTLDKARKSKRKRKKKQAGNTERNRTECGGDTNKRFLKNHPFCVWTDLPWERFACKCVIQPWVVGQAKRYHRKFI